MKPTALVTGSSRGIGRGIAHALAKAGYDVAINYTRNEAAAQEAAGGVRDLGGKALLCRADIADTAQGRDMVDQVIGDWGRLDLLVNNAGIAPRVRADLLGASEDSYDELMATNLRGPYFLTQYAANRMVELQGRGVVEIPRIVIISSVSAFTSSPARGEYCVSKAGLTMMTRLFADRLAGNGIPVIEIQPGIILTDMTGPVKEKYDAQIEDGLVPFRRWGTPADIGGAVTAVALGYLDFATGAAIPVDGGFHLKRL
jgi:3-oxoacyl-[acyl-carrier protein] reductase